MMINSPELLARYLHKELGWLIYDISSALGVRVEQIEGWLDE